MGRRVFAATAAGLLLAAAVQAAELPTEDLANDVPAPGAEAEVAAPNLSAGTREVLRLSEAGVDAKVILGYVQSVSTAFQLSAADLIYLKDVGLDETIVTAMQERDQALAKLAAAGGATTTNAPTNVVATATAPPGPVELATNAPTQVGYFYDQLAPYGSWIAVDDLGWCWRPTTVVLTPDWRPYWHGGHWIWTDAGWYWRSDYTWGWAPFHYGRWHHHPHHGWLWFPDLHWGPAWVTWRVSNEYCGWAPLPPGARVVAGRGWLFHGVSVNSNFDFHLGVDLFNFVEIGHLPDRHPRLHGLPRARIPEIRGGLTVVNQYAVGPSHLVVNQGVPVAKVNSAAHVTLPRYQIRDAPRAVGAPGARDQLPGRGAGTVVYRPELKPPARSNPAVAQRLQGPGRIVHSVPAPRRPGTATGPAPTPGPIAGPTPGAVPGGRPMVRPGVRLETPAQPTGREAPTRVTPPAWQSPASPRSVVPVVPRVESPRGAAQRPSPPMVRPAPVPAAPAQASPTPRAPITPRSPQPGQPGPRRP